MFGPFPNASMHEQPCPARAFWPARCTANLQVGPDELYKQERRLTDAQIELFLLDWSSSLIAGQGQANSKWRRGDGWEGDGPAGQ